MGKAGICRRFEMLNPRVGRRGVVIYEWEDNEETFVTFIPESEVNKVKLEVDDVLVSIGLGKAEFNFDAPVYYNTDAVLKEVWFGPEVPIGHL